MPSTLRKKALPEIGETWEQPIDEILASWPSCDGADPKRSDDSWDAVLDGKRCDGHYEDVVESISRNGFTRPVTCYVASDHGMYAPFDKERYARTQLVYGDGHHRLAAAIDLGMTHVPMQMTTSMSAIARDSGCWSLDYEVEED